MSAESAKVRLVRCPKCDNLLPELADYSVYQCGGCGALLRAKKTDPESDTLSEMSDEERVGGVSINLDSFLEKGMSNNSHNFFEKGISDLTDAPETDTKSNRSYPTRDDNWNDDGRRRVAPEKYKNYPKVTADKWIVENDLDMKMSRDKLGNASTGTQTGAGRSQGTGHSSDWRIGDRGERERFRRNQRTVAEGVRFPSSNYPDEGPSNNYSGSSYGGYEKALSSHNDSDGFNTVQCLEQDRAELLRQLDELKDQLSRSCSVVEKPKNNVPLAGSMIHQEPYADTGTWFRNDSASSNRSSMQFFPPDKYVAQPPYNSHYPEPHPFVNRHEMAMHSVYPAMQISHNISSYGDPVRSQMRGRAPHQVPVQYLQQPSHPYFSGQYRDAPLDPFEPYSPNPALHHPSCSCVYCYDKHQQVSAPVPPTAFGNKMFLDVRNNPTFYNQKNPGAFGPQGYNAKIVNPPPLSSHDPRPHMRWPSDGNSDMGGGVRGRPHMVVPAKSGRRCRPVASGAPFITCHNCFELLQLPKKILLLKKIKQKMQCGACSVVLYCAVLDKKLSVSVHAEMEQTVTAVSNSSEEVAKHSHGHMNQASMNFYSDDFDSSGYDFQSMDRAPLSSLTGHDLNSSKTQGSHSLHSSSATSSEDETSQDGLIARREVANSVDLPKKATLSPPPPGSSLQEYFDYSSNNQAINRFSKGNQSSRSDQEKVTQKKVTSRQNSITDASVATEMEVSFNEYSNTGVSHDSGDTGREEIRPKINKGGESFLEGIIKKSFQSAEIVEDGKSNVTVNGHPLPDRLINKAEKLAGPVHPGEYWYDFRAGFWGVIGGPCLGIIPPYIEEFNYPMPENCAGGNTRVYVNGRELNQKDLELLSSRGLPPCRDRSYVVDISGKVIDEDTGEELDSLGKLAPTVEKARHGFGMKVPRTAAR